MPCLEQLSTTCLWTINIECKSEFLAVCPGKLAKIIETKKNTRIYQYQINSPQNCVKIGFCIANMRCANTQDHPLLYYFSITKKASDCIEQVLIPAKICRKMVELCEKYLGIKMGTPLNILFLPNLNGPLCKLTKLAHKFAGLIILDERMVLNHNVIEYRHKIYETIGEAIAFKFFGEQISEENYWDYWLFQSLRYSLAKKFKIERCGLKIHQVIFIDRIM